MKSKVKSKIQIKGLSCDKHLSNELEDIIQNIILQKLSILAKNMLDGCDFYKDEIAQYLQWLGENTLQWKEEHADWTDTWIGVIKPYILNHFPDENLLHCKRFGIKNRNLYDTLGNIAEYSDLHDE